MVVQRLKYKGKQVTQRSYPHVGSYILAEDRQQIYNTLGGGKFSENEVE